MAIVDIAFKGVMDATDKVTAQIEYIKSLENTYEREKTAIDAKVNSTTQMKHMLIKNTKVESKISNTNSTKEEKLKYFDDTIKDQYEKLNTKSTAIRDLYDNKLEREIEALENKIKEVKLKYEMKKQIELTDLNQRTESYITHLNRQRKLVEDKNDTVIRDLSANIIVTNIGDVFDEDAYPRLTKLKFDIQVEKDRLVKLQQAKAEAQKRYDDTHRRWTLSQQAEARERYNEEERKEEEKMRMLKQQREREREDQNYRDRLRQDERRKEMLLKEQAEEQSKSWKENVYKKLPAEYRKYYSLFGKEERESMTELDLNEVIKHIDTLKPLLINLQKLEDVYHTDDNKYFKDEVWDMYIHLPFKSRLEIAQKNKLGQVTLIKKYHAEIAVSESDSEED